MKTRTLKQLLLYNYRYMFAYVIIFGFMAYFLGWQLGTIGPGLSNQEVSVAARHTSVAEIIKMPVYPLHSVLQRLSIEFLGVTTISLRLPGVIIALFTAALLYKLLKKWFGKQTALLCTALLVSADWFLFIARVGTGAVEFSFWLTLSLLCYTKLVERKTKWLILFAGSLVGLFFTPFGPYAAIALAASLFSFKLFRERLKEAHTAVHIISGFIILLGATTAVYITVKDVNFLKNVLGLTTLPSLTEYVKNVIINTSAVVAVLPDANPLISPTGIFFVRFFELIFILFGIAMFWKTRVNRLNLVVLCLSVVLVLTSGLSSGSRGGSTLLIPAAIYMTAGIRHLLHRWKRTFPKNPYARVAAYAPLGVLFVCTVALHYYSYFWLWPGQTATQQTFNPDILLAQQELNKAGYSGKTCLVETKDIALQKLLITSDTTCKIVFPSNAGSAERVSAKLMNPTSSDVDKVKDTVRPLTSDAADGNVRWLVVQIDK